MPKTLLDYYKKKRKKWRIGFRNLNFEIAEDLFLISPLQFWYATLLVGYLAQEDVEPEPEGEPEPELGWSILFLTMLIKR